MARENENLNFDEEDTLRQTLNSFESITLEEEKSLSSTAAAATKLDDDASEVQVTCFADVIDDVTLYFRIIRLPQQCNTVSVATLIKGSCEDPMKSIARRLVLKTGLPVTAASNIPKNSPVLEVNAEKKLVDRLINLEYRKPKLERLSS